MKLFKLISTTAVAVAALAISASAMTAQYVAPQGEEPGKVELTGITTNAEQKTLLVLNNDATTVAEDDIVQIDQAASFATVVVGDLAAEIDAANTKLVEAYEKTPMTKADWDELDAAWQAETEEYVVRVGGSGTIETAYFTVPTTVQKPVEPEDLPPEPEYMLGDIIVDGDINDDDVYALDFYYQFMLEEFIEYFGEDYVFWEDPEHPGWLGADIIVDGDVNDDDVYALDFYYQFMLEEFIEYFGEDYVFWE